MSVGPWQVIIILLIVVLLFGGSRLGEIGKGLGEGIKNFKKGVGGDDGPPKRITTTKTSEVPGERDEQSSEESRGTGTRSDRDS